MGNGPMKSSVKWRNEASGGARGWRNPWGFWIDGLFRWQASHPLAYLMQSLWHLGHQNWRLTRPYSAAAPRWPYNGDSWSCANIGSRRGSGLGHWELCGFLDKIYLLGNVFSNFLSINLESIIFALDMTWLLWMSQRDVEFAVVLIRFESGAWLPSMLSRSEYYLEVVICE